jgi:methyl-accepting chemotaxis protein
VNVENPRDTLDRRQLLSALRSLRRGDFSVRLPEDLPGVDSEIAAVFNEVVGLNQQMTQEFERLSQVVGKEGKITQRGRVKNATGGWETAIRSVNELIEDMVQPTAEVARVIGAVAKGDLSQSMTVEIDGRPLRGEFLRIGKVVNTMVEQLASFASEVTRVAREVGTEGKLGGQATVKGVAGTWKDLTDNVNAMATNLTGQVRNIADVTTAVAIGRLVQEDHGGGEGRDPRAQEHHQHHGGPAQLLRVRSDPRGPRGRLRRKALAARRAWKASPAPGPI